MSPSRPRRLVRRFASASATLVVRRFASATLPPSTRWIVAEARKPPAFTNDGRLRSGLNVLEPDRWLLSDADDEEIIRSKRAALDDGNTRASLYVTDDFPSTIAAESEAFALIDEIAQVHAISRAADRQPQRAATSGTLVEAARHIREDLVLLRQHDDARAVMAAACVCFSFGQLPAKLGQPLASIHRPVPGYEASLQRPLDRLFETLTPEKGFWRSNFEFRWTGELLHPSARGDPNAKGDLTHVLEPADSSDAAPDDGTLRDNGLRGPRCMHLRVEYQTLRRLPRSRHILFTIRSYIDPLSEIAASPAAAAALASRVEALSDDFAEYKGISRAMRPRIQQYLQSGGAIV